LAPRDPENPDREREHALAFVTDARRGLSAGYRKVRPVSEKDLAMLPLFLLVRGLAEMGWFADRPENATPAELNAMKDFVVAQCREFREGRLSVPATV